MFYVHEVRNSLRASNFRTPARPAGFENFRLWSIGGSGGLLRPCPVYPRKQTPSGRVGMSAGSIPDVHSPVGEQRPDGSLAQMAGEELIKALMLLIFCVAAEPVPFFLIKMYFGSPAMLLQSFP
jgi:hypothetical protein